MTILFDGLDLSGKTAVAREVAARLGAAYNAGGITNDMWARFGRRVFRSSVPNMVKGFVFMGSFLIDTLHSPPAQDGILVQDRYWPSLMAYTRASYPRPISAIITALINRYARLDVNIHVTCSVDERRRRFESRGSCDRIDRCLLRDPEFAQRYEDHLMTIMSALPNYMLLDTTDRAVGESVELALAHIARCRTQ